MTSIHIERFYANTFAFSFPLIYRSVLDLDHWVDLLQVMRSIRDNITEDILLNEINEIIRLPMYADRIRTDSKANHHPNMARRR